MKEEAINQVSIEVDYPRPYFDFPDLAGEGGNTFVFWKQAESVLSRQGFKKESNYIHNKFMKMNYDDLFNYLYRFLDFSPKEEVVKEDDEAIYIKINKNKLYSDKDIKQPLLFNIKNLETIKDLYEAGEDFSIKNCYGRNILHYVNDVDILKFLLEKNEQDNFIDLFELDAFNSPILFTHENPNTFVLLLEQMHKENEDIADLLLRGTNIFNENSLGVYLKSLDIQFARKNMKNLDINQWEDFTKQLVILKKIQPDLTDKLIKSLDLLPIFEEKPELKNLHLYTLLNTMMPINEKKSKLSKI